MSFEPNPKECRGCFWLQKASGECQVALAVWKMTNLESLQSFLLDRWFQFNSKKLGLEKLDRAYSYKKTDLGVYTTVRETEDDNSPYSLENPPPHALSPEEEIRRIVGDGFEPWRILYHAHLLSAEHSRIVHKQYTPVWVFKHSPSLWVLHRYFKLNEGVNEIAGKLNLSPGYVSKTVSQCRNVLHEHLQRVYKKFPCEMAYTYFFKYFFEQQTVTQLAEIAEVSHQTVSKSIRRVGKKIVESLQNEVASREVIRGKRKIEFTPLLNNNEHRRTPWSALGAKTDNKLGGNKK
jgi:predicted DNA-binding protein YlxM (UPF0122 family)